VDRHSRLEPRLRRSNVDLDFVRRNLRRLRAHQTAGVHLRGEGRVVGARAVGRKSHAERRGERSALEREGADGNEQHAPPRRLHASEPTCVLLGGSMNRARLPPLLAAVVGLAVALMACNPAPGTCSVAVPDASITINVEFASEQSSTVVTEGACSPASCASPVANDAGCAVWRATQTGTQGDVCRVGILDPNDGGFLLEKSVVDQTACGFYEAQIVQF
jgi:hypothetical protein